MVLAAQHDPIVLAKQVATLDHLSGGRAVLGIGFGWNRQEAADHGVDFADRRQVAREHVLCMQALWRDDPAEYHGEYVDLDPCWSWPKPVRAPGARPGRAVARRPPTSPPSPSTATDGCRSEAPGLGEALPVLRQAFEDAGRDPAGARVVPFGTIPTDAKLDHFAELGIDEVVLRVPGGSRSEVLAVLDAHAAFVTGSGATVTDGQPRRPGPPGRPWSGGGREELAAAVRRLMELTVTSAPGAGGRWPTPPPGWTRWPTRLGSVVPDDPEPVARFAEYDVAPDEVVGTHRRHALRHGGRDVQSAGAARRASGSTPPVAGGGSSSPRPTRGRPAACTVRPSPPPSTSS